MITIYRWDMRSPVTVGLSGVKRSETGWRVGHVSLRVTGGEPAGDWYMSWFPSEHGAFRSKARVGQTFADDIALEKGPPLPPLQVGTAGKTLDETNIKAWWHQFVAHPPKWVLTSTNCSQLVVDALRAGGADQYLGKDLLGVIPPWESWSVVWRPWSIPDYVAAINQGLAGS